MWSISASARVTSHDGTKEVVRMRKDAGAVTKAENFSQTLYRTVANGRKVTIAMLL